MLVNCWFDGCDSWTAVLTAGQLCCGGTVHPSVTLSYSREITVFYYQVALGCSILKQNFIWQLSQRVNMAHMLSCEVVARMLAYRQPMPAYFKVLF